VSSCVSSGKTGKAIGDLNTNSADIFRNVPEGDWRRPGMNREKKSSMANRSRIYTGTPHKVCNVSSVLPIPDAVAVSPSMKIEGAEKGVSGSRSSSASEKEPKEKSTLFAGS